MHDVDGALQDFSKAIELKPDFALPYAYRGIARFFDKRDTSGVAEDFNQALRLDPTLAKGALSFFVKGVGH